jgi:hypothetical protein
MAAELTLVAIAAGDPSVGIQSLMWSVGDLGTLDDYPEQREEVRQAFLNAFSLVAGEPVRVTFSDEWERD